MALNDLDDSDELPSLSVEVPAETPTETVKPSDRLSFEDDDDDPMAQMESIGVHQEPTAADIRKPWMANHDFVLISTVDELRQLVDQAIQHGRCSLDLETQGLDNRINYRDGQPKTVHSIVGYCISINGKTGYYVPVNHKAPDSINLPFEEAAQEIKRLCLASQPILTEEGQKKEPLASQLIAEKSKCVIYFWNAKFDQEFLYPITGIDFWHPESFEDGLLLYYCIYTDDKHLSLKDKAPEKLRTTLSLEQSKKWFRHDYNNGNTVPKEVPYEMIQLKELFVGGRKDIHFDQITPQDGLFYAASDAICTYLLCDTPEFKNALTNKKYTGTYRLEKQVVQVMRKVERNRVGVDKAYVQQLLEEANIEAKGYEEAVVEMARARGYPNFDIRSSKKISEFLFGANWLDISPKPEMNQASGQYKTDVDTLETLFESNHSNTVLANIVKFRQIDKVIGTYLTNLNNNCDELDQIRVQFKQVGAATGRFSAPGGQPDHGFGGVPIHGIPSTYDDKKPKVATSLRKIFKARKGYSTLKVDYAAEELRIATNVSKEPVWMKEFLEGTGDLHSITARAFFNKQEVTKQERQMGKCVHPDTLVFVDGVLKPIKDIGEFGPNDTFIDSPLGTKKVFNGNKYVDVVATYNGGVKPLVHVVTNKGIITCTRQHLFLTRAGKLCKAGALEVQDKLAPISLPTIDFEGELNNLSTLDLTSPRVPDCVLNGGKKAIKQYLWWVLFCGGDTKENKVVLSLGDYIYAGQIATLANLVHLDFDIKLNETVDSDSYVRVASNQVDLIFDRSFLHPSSDVKNIPTNHYVGDHIVLDVIQAGEGPCLDISLSTEDHIYVANGISTHNTSNFALLYGGGAQAVVRACGCTEQEGARRKAAFDKAVPTFTSWIKKQHVEVTANKGITTAFGRWIAIPDIDSPDKMKQAGAKRCSINFPIQGCLNRYSKVLTNLGPIEIGDLSTNKPKGCKVWTGSSWADFKAVDMGPWQLAQIQLSDGGQIDCDTRHKVLLVKDTGYQWVDFEDLQEGDNIATPIHSPVEFPGKELPLNDFLKTPEDTKEFWYWVGRYYGDGWISSRDNSLTYAFGVEEVDDIERAINFFSSVGLNPIPRVLSKITRSGKYCITYSIIVENKELKTFLGALGINPSNAHTKRLPDWIYSETLTNRKSFMQGFMDSDGGKPKGGNPYNLHLCQRPLLEDTKLLLRSLGVESRIMGPYSYTNKYQETFESYRLDIQRRMYDAKVDDLDEIRRPRFNYANAPKFIRDEFVEKLKGKLTKKLSTDSESVLYSRVKQGGDITVYTIQDICKKYGVTLDSPIYSYKTVTKKTTLDKVENTYTLMVQDDLHRYEADGVIHKNTGGDIMKIALVLLHKEFYRRGWIQADDVRILLTVHDEIVFEVRNEKVPDIIPVVVECMEMPGRLKADWKIPLVVEPLLDSTWDAKYNWDLIMKGEVKPPKPDEKLKSYEVRVGDKIYHRVPPWLEGIVTPPWLADAPKEVVVHKEAEEVPQPAQEKVTAPKVTQVAPSNPTPVRSSDKVDGTPWVRKIGILTKNTTRTVMMAIVETGDEESEYVLHLTDGFGNVLIDAAMGIRINVVEFNRALKKANLI